MNILTKEQAKALHSVVTARKDGEQLFVVMLKGKGIVTRSYFNELYNGNFVFIVNYFDVNDKDSLTSVSLSSDTRVNSTILYLEDFKIHIVSQDTEYVNGVRCFDCAGTGVTHNENEKEESCCTCNGSGVIEAGDILSTISRNRTRTVLY